MTSARMSLDWQASANCAGIDAAVFFPESQGDHTRDAKLICSRCTVREECLRYALAHRIEHGVWGQTSPADRERIRRSGRIPVLGPVLCRNGLHEMPLGVTRCMPCRRSAERQANLRRKLGA